MKKIAITGATGFLGKYLVRYYSQQKDVELFLYSTSMKKLTETFEKDSKISFVETDYSYGSLKHSFLKYDAFIHLSAKRQQPNLNLFSDFYENIQHTESILRLCDEFHVEVFVLASSISVYNSKKNKLPFDETQILSPITPYGISKYVCESLFSLYKTKSVSLRFSQLIGWGEREGYMFTSSLKKVQNNEPIVLWGNGEGGRDYLYVKDAIDAIEKCIEYKISGIYNIGSGVSVSFKEFAEVLCDVFGNENSTIQYDKSKTENKEILKMDIQKSKKIFFWTPRYSLYDAFKDMRKEQFCI